MFFRVISALFILFPLFFCVGSISANATDCKIQVINLTAKESSEIYKESKHRKSLGTQELLISNFSINNDVDYEGFYKKLDGYVKAEKGEIDINSLSFVDLVKSMNDNNMLAILNIFGENKFDKKTNLYFKDTKIRMRYKDVVSELLMSRLGERLWSKYYPYPSWNVPITEGKHIIQYPYKSKFSLPPYNPDNKYFFKPIIKSEREWRKYNGDYEYYILLSGYYDKNTYYTWRDEWINRKSRNNGEWNRDYAWLEKTINEYKGSDGELMVKLNNAKNNLQGFCN